MGSYILFARKITPLVYLSGKMFCVIAGFAAGVMFGIVAAFVFAVPAFSIRIYMRG